MQNILVIGGSYFLGRVFLEQLTRSHGYQVYVFNRGNVPLSWQGIHEIRGDREISAQIRTIPRLDWDVVIDFCGYDPRHIDNLINHLPGRIRHYIFISTTSVYADNTDVPLAENARKVSAPDLSLGEYAAYGFNKWLAECALKQACRERSIDYTILRPAIIYGRYNYAPREFFLFDQIVKNHPLVLPETSPTPRFSFVWVDDLARIIHRCIQNGSVVTKSFNIAGPERISYVDLIAILERICDRTLKTIQMPIEEIVRRNIPLPFPPDIDLLYDGTAIGKLIDGAYTPFEKGMAETWQHYIEVHSGWN